tara:strand:- start:2773 stop:2946 length:174 start_codon:yes stop_codon:yes gene_type:complete
MNTQLLMNSLIEKMHRVEVQPTNGSLAEVMYDEGYADALEFALAVIGDLIEEKAKAA